MPSQIQPIKECSHCHRNFYSSDDFLAHTSRWRICEDDNLWFNCTCESTQVIMKGRFPWYDPQRRLSPEGKSVFNFLPHIKSIPRIPTRVMQILQLLDEPNTTSKDLATIAKQDPFIASKILKIAESRLIKNQTQLKSLEHAISLLGHTHLKEITLIAAIASMKPNTKIFNLELFWEHSLTIGRIAEYLTERWPNLFIADEAYIASSLCNLGKLVLALCRPDLADRFQEQIDDIHQLSPWMQAEQDYGGFHHTVLGEIGACFWGLSQSTVDVIQQHHMVANVHIHKHVQLHELAGIANQFTHWIKLQPHRMDHGLFQGLLRRFQLQPSDAELLASDMMHLAFVN